MTPSSACPVRRVFRQLAKDEKRVVTALRTGRFHVNHSATEHTEMPSPFQCPDPDCHRPHVSLSDKRRHFQLHHLTYLLHRSRVSNAFS